MGNIVLRIRAVTESERREPHSPQQAWFKGAAKQGPPERPGILWHFPLAGGGQGKNDDGRFDNVSQLDRVHVEDCGIEAKPLGHSPDFFGYILGISRFGSVEDEGRFAVYISVRSAKCYEST